MISHLDIVQVSRLHRVMSGVAPLVVNPIFFTSLNQVALDFPYKNHRGPSLEN